MGTPKMASPKSKYEEMCEAAETGRAEWVQYRDRCMSYLDLLIVGFVPYCEIPSADCITYLKLNKAVGQDASYREADKGEFPYSLFDATVFNAEDRYWHLGVGVRLGPLNVFPQLWSGFVFCVSEDKGKPIVKVGLNGTPRQIDFGDSIQTAEVYEEAIEFTKKRFEDSRRNLQKIIGFR